MNPVVREMTDLATQYGRWLSEDLTALKHHQGWTVNTNASNDFGSREG